MRYSFVSQRVSIIDERPDSGQSHYRRADGKRPAAASRARRRVWLAHYPWNPWTSKIKLDFTHLVINLICIGKTRFTLKGKG